MHFSTLVAIEPHLKRKGVILSAFHVRLGKMTERIAEMINR